MANSTWANARIEVHETVVQMFMPVGIIESMDSLPLNCTQSEGLGRWVNPETGQCLEESIVVITMSGYIQPVVDAMRQIISHAFEHDEQAVYVIIDGKAFIYHRQ